ncbi:hypothetical protein HDU85_007594, partial [Gaertneriomyces sp. JEL0708]
VGCIDALYGIVIVENGAVGFGFDFTGPGIITVEYGVVSFNFALSNNDIISYSEIPPSNDHSSRVPNPVHSGTLGGQNGLNMLSASIQVQYYCMRARATATDSNMVLFWVCHYVGHDDVPTRIICGGKLRTFCQLLCQIVSNGSTKDLIARSGHLPRTESGEGKRGNEEERK